MNDKAINKRGLISLTVLLVVFVLLLGIEIGGYFKDVNQDVNAGIPHSSSLTVKLFTASADIVAVLYIIVVPIYFIYRYRKIPSDYVSAVFSLVAAMIIVALLKILVGEARPGASIIHYSITAAIWNLDYFAFPSGHTARATVIGWYLGKGRNIVIKALLVVWVLGIAVSRLVLSAHWFGDVVTSLDLGALVCLAIDGTKKRWIGPYNKIVKSVPQLQVMNQK